MNSSAAISSLLRPRPTRASTSRSRSTDRAHGLAGRDRQIEHITRNILDRLGEPAR
ncbi:MAG TPA: hypothetical protein VIL36_04060 [Acidimicrobiales bacterium]